MVHRNILAARSPVFADLLARMEADKVRIHFIREAKYIDA